jgi:hypothetical protein
MAFVCCPEVDLKVPTGPRGSAAARRRSSLAPTESDSGPPVAPPSCAQAGSARPVTVSRADGRALAAESPGRETTLCGPCGSELESPAGSESPVSASVTRRFRTPSRHGPVAPGRRRAVLHTPVLRLVTFSTGPGGAGPAAAGIGAPIWNP